VTGGVGSGKSTVSRLFGEWSASVIEADPIGWELLQPESPVYDTVCQAFDAEILDSSGNIDRRRLGRVVFSSREHRQRLDQIIHPFLLKELKRRISEVKRIAPIVVVDAALIYEWGIQDWFDMVIAVTAPEGVRLDRLQASGLSREEASDRIRSQIDQEEKAARADMVIVNEGSLEALRERTAEVWQAIRRKWPQIRIRLEPQMDADQHRSG
jgi:dephospho-CoA kinase